METPDSSDTGPHSPSTSDAVSCMARQMIARLSAAIGCIEPQKEQTIWANLRDVCDHPLGQVSIHVTPHDPRSRVDLLLHGVNPSVQKLLRPVALAEQGGGQVNGEWQEHAPSCRFSVRKDSSVVLRMSVAERLPAEDAARVVE